MQTPQISLEDTKRFSRVWTRNGIAIILPDVALDFATDFANIILRNFIESAVKEAAEKARQQQAAQIVLTE